MGVFCISDIHGYFDEFQEMLSLINFSAKDELYILGDIFDRGPQSAEMLWYAIKEAPANVHFLLGNHEDMALAANYYDRDSLTMRMYDTWFYNGGQNTVDQIKFFNKHFPRFEQEILDWIDCLPFFFDIMVNNKRFILVHAGLQSEFARPDDRTSRGKEFELQIPGIETKQNTQAMLWNRASWLADKFEWPFDVISGHTPTCNLNWDFMRNAGFTVEQSREKGIVHINGRKHLIDCGVHKGNLLGCLRLEDMQEFYVKSKQYKEDWG